MEKQCINCKKTFECKTSKAKYCCDKCRHSYKYTNYKNHTFTCKGCGKEVSSNRNDLQFCSKKCSKVGNQEVTLEKIVEEIEKNPQISAKKLCTKLKTSLRNLYYLMESSGYKSYKELIGIVKGVYLEKQRSDTSIAALNCFDYISSTIGKPYKTEVTFEGLVNPRTEKNLRVDCFFEEDNLAVEYHGIQHYKIIPYFHRGQNTLEYQKFKDSIKEQYFAEKGIKYIVIPYWYTEKDIYAETIKSRASGKTEEGLETKDTTVSLQPPAPIL